MWPAVGYPKADDDENGSNGNGGVGVAVDGRAAASHGAVRLASSVGDEAGAPERREP